MGKHRKRTNLNVPAKGRLCDIADRLWSKAIATDWNHKCAVCGKGPSCDAHHIVPRQHEATRYDLRNGIALCSSHHQFCPELSPHQNAAGWMQWLRDNQTLRYEWYVSTIVHNGHRSFDGVKNAPYYCDVIMSFREYVEPEQFVEIVGVKFSKWLIETKGT